MSLVPQPTPETYRVYESDLSSSAYNDFARQPLIAWDIETNGLDWREHRIGLCQLYAPELPVAIVRIHDTEPEYLRKLVGDPHVKKVFHHAMFDLRFLTHWWSAQPRNIACTKIASKLLFPDEPQAQKLQSLLARYLDVHVDKTEQLSDWFARSYSPSQIAYAFHDVVHLPDLLNAMLADLERRRLGALAEQCFAHIPARVTLDLGGFGDVFTY